MNLKKKIIIILLIVLSSISFMQCNGKDIDTTQDSNYNMTIQNLANYKLILYYIIPNEGILKYLKHIPKTARHFAVNIPNESIYNSAVILVLYRAQDVKDINNPPTTHFRREEFSIGTPQEWQIKLAEDEPAPTDPNFEVPTQGKLMFIYEPDYGAGDISWDVDIYFGSFEIDMDEGSDRLGEFITNMKPESRKVVTLNLDTKFDVYYRYYTTIGGKYHDVIKKEKDNDIIMDEVNPDPIYIPPLKGWEGPEEPTIQGIEVYNLAGSSVEIYVNGERIDKSGSVASYVKNKNKKTFEIDGTGEYTFEAKSSDGSGLVVDSVELIIEKGSTSIWHINPSDTINPTISSISPADMDYAISTETNIKVEFSEDMMPIQVIQAFSMEDSNNNPIECEVISPENNSPDSVFIFKPSIIEGDTNYTIALSSKAKDLAGNSLNNGEDFSSVFTTKDNPEF